MEENPKPRRRWFRFSLRTMLVLVTLVCVYLGWAMNWRRQRQTILSTPGIETVILAGDSAPLAPLLLWPVGEKGYYGFAVFTGEEDVSSGDEDNAKEARRLFPESIVYIYIYSRGRIFHFRRAAQD